MKKLISLLLALAGLAAHAQNVLDPAWISNTANGSITTAGTGTNCSIVTSCTWIVLPLNSLAVQAIITGTWSGTLQFESATDGKTWSAIPATNGLTSATANGNIAFQTPQIGFFRVRASAWSSGRASVALTALPYVPYIAGGGGSGANVLAGPLTAGALVNSASPSTIQTPNTTATLDGSGNIATPGGVTAGGNLSTGGSVQGTSPAPGASIQTAGTGSVNGGSLPANSAGWMAPNTGGTSFLYQPPSTATIGFLFAGAPTTINGVNGVPVTHVALGFTPLSAGTPTVSSCGSNYTLSANSTDAAGSISVPSAQTACQIVFSQTYSSSACVVTDRSGAALTYTPGTSTLTVSSPQLASTTFDWFCHR